MNAKARFIPEENLAISGFRLAGNGGKGLAAPLFDRFRITLIGTLQRFLRRQSEPGKQGTDGAQTKPDLELLLD
jgi:hypothetical protein